MKNGEQKQRREKWKKLVDDYAKSGMTQKAFCEQNQLNLPQLVYYHSQFKPGKQLPESKPTFAPVKIAAQEKNIPPGEIKLSLPNGFQCAFPSYIDINQVKRLVEVLLSC